VKREATISADGLYRLDLTRSVQPGCPCKRCTAFRTGAAARGVPPSNAFVLFALCNPSKADAETDDATERRGWGFTLASGYPSFKFVNTNPYRSTDPKKALVPDELVLLQNDLYLIAHAQAASVVVCAWGENANPVLAARTLRILRAKSNVPVCALALTKGGWPKHPLYLSGKLKPEAF